MAKKVTTIINNVRMLFGLKRLPFLFDAGGRTDGSWIVVKDEQIKKQ